MTRLQEELMQCRRDGFAVDFGDVKHGLNTIAAPVLHYGQTPIGYITLIGFFPLEAAKSFGPLIAKAGKTLSRQMGATF